MEIDCHDSIEVLHSDLADTLRPHKTHVVHKSVEAPGARQVAQNAFGLSQISQVNRHKLTRTGGISAPGESHYLVSSTDQPFS
ncbi:hypothetical protein CS8_071680 [Cupriavidus sp. 8B]